MNNQLEEVKINNNLFYYKENKPDIKNHILKTAYNKANGHDLSKSFVVYYHHPCTDGEFCKYLLQNANICDAAVSVYPVFNVLDIKSNVVIFADVLPKEDQLYKLLETTKVILLDHHKKPDFKEHHNLLNLCDTNQSATMLVLEFIESLGFNSSEQIKKVAKFVSDYDTGKFYDFSDESKITNVFTLNYFYNKFKNDIKSLLNNDVFEICQHNGLKNYKTFINTEFEYKIIDINDEKIYKIVMCDGNKYNKYSKGDIASLLSNKTNLPSCCYGKKGKYITSSWRVANNLNFDISEFVSKYGGGGHPKASGLKLPEEKWNEIFCGLNLKKLNNLPKKISNNSQFYIVLLLSLIYPIYWISNY